MCIVSCGRWKSEIDLGFLVGVPVQWGGGGAVTLAPGCRGAPVQRVAVVQVGVSRHWSR